MIKKNYNMKELLEIKKNLKKDFSNLKTIKVALLGDTATQFLTQALRGLGYDSGFNIDICEADFDQIESRSIEIFRLANATSPFRYRKFDRNHMPPTGIPEMAALPKTAQLSSILDS